MRSPTVVYNQKIIFSREIGRVGNKCKWADPDSEGEKVK